MTTCLQRPVEESKTWAGMFPNDQCTEQLSALFVKKILAVAVSNIAYLRAIFPEDAFRDRSLEGLSLKILRDDISCPGANQVVKWVRGAFDALDKKYLRSVMLGLYIDPDDPDTVLESYTFTFSYRDGHGVDIYRNDEKISSTHSGVETRKSTICLLRTLILLTQTLDALPDNVMMTMKLLYYDEVTPEDYEPPGFKAASTNSFEFDDEPVTIRVGDVETPFHSIKGRFITGKRQFLKESQETQEVDQEKEIETGLDDEAIERMSQEKTQENQEPNSNADIPKESPAKPGENAVDNNGSEQSQNTETGEEFKVRCPCGCNEDDGVMIMCGVCKLWQHGICFLIMTEEEAPDRHVCDVCAEEGTVGREPTDPILLNLSTIQMQATCLWRRTLLACLEYQRIIAPVLAKRLGTEIIVAQGLLNRLEKEGYVKAASGRRRQLGKIVDKEKITNEAIPKYMTKKDKIKNTVTNKATENDADFEPIKTDEPENKIDNIPKMKEPVQIQNCEVDKLTEETEKLKINNKKERLSRKKNRGGNKKQVELSRIEDNSEKVKEMQVEEEKKEQEKIDAKRKKRKRAIPKNDSDQEFEFSSTQEEPRKRKKSSKVHKDIMDQEFEFSSTQEEPRKRKKSSKVHKDIMV